MIVLATTKRLPANDPDILNCEKHPASNPDWQKLARKEKSEELTMGFSAHLVMLEREKGEAIQELIDWQNLKP